MAASGPVYGPGSETEDDAPDPEVESDDGEFHDDEDMKRSLLHELARSCADIDAKLPDAGTGPAVIRCFAN